MVTGMDPAAVDDETMLHGAVDFLVKSEITPNLLERSIRYAVLRSADVREARRTRARYELAIHGAREAVWEWDLTAGRVWISKELWALLGDRSPGRWVPNGDAFRRVVDDDQEVLQKRLDSLQRGGGGHFVFAVNMVDCEGLPVPVEWRGVTVREGERVTLAGVASVAQARGVVARPSTDLTSGVRAQVQARRRLEQLDGLHDAIRTAQSRIVQALHGEALGDPGPSLEELLRRSLDLTGSPAGFIGVARARSEGEVLEAYAVDEVGRFTEPVAFPLARFEERVGDAPRRGRPSINEPGPEGLFPRAWGVYERLLTLPIVLGGRFVGVVGVANRVDGY